MSNKISSKFNCKNTFYPSEVNENLKMFEPLNPSEFCRRWVPEKKGKQPKEYGYRRECCKLLSELTGYGENTTNNWLKDTYDTSELVKRYLRVVDTLWQIEKLLGISLYKGE